MACLVYTALSSSDNLCSYPPFKCRLNVKWSRWASIYNVGD